MKTPCYCPLALFILVLVLSGCDLRAAPVPTGTPVPPTATRTFTSTPLPSSSPTALPTFTRRPSSTPTLKPGYIPINTLAISPTPAPGWTTYTNDYLGYSFNYPVGGRISARGADTLETDTAVPPGFTFDEYFNYVMAILPESLCVSVGIPGALITIVPPYPLAGYVVPCPGMGIGDQYRIENVSETWTVAGKDYKDSHGGKLYLKSTGAFYSEYHFFDLQNGFRVVYNGGPGEAMSAETYRTQKSAAMRILAALRWFRLPDLTIPGTTCAGKYTRLLAGVEAIVTGAPTDPPNRVRSQPGKAGEIISQIYPESIVKVVEGPVCADGLVFWRVENALIPGGSGWTAEGDGTEYWLEPYRP